MDRHGALHDRIPSLRERRPGISGFAGGRCLRSYTVAPNQRWVLCEELLKFISFPPKSNSA